MGIYDIKDKFEAEAVKRERREWVLEHCIQRGMDLRRHFKSYPMEPVMYPAIKAINLAAPPEWGFDRVIVSDIIRTLCWDRVRTINRRKRARERRARGEPAATPRPRKKKYEEFEMDDDSSDGEYNGTPEETAIQPVLVGRVNPDPGASRIATSPGDTLLTANTAWKERPFTRQEGGDCDIEQPFALHQRQHRVNNSPTNIRNQKQYQLQGGVRSKGPHISTAEGSADPTQSPGTLQIEPSPPYSHSPLRSPFQSPVWDEQLTSHEGNRYQSHERYIEPPAKPSNRTAETPTARDWRPQQSTYGKRARSPLTAAPATSNDTSAPSTVAASRNVQQSYSNRAKSPRPGGQHEPIGDHGGAIHSPNARIAWKEKLPPSVVTTTPRHAHNHTHGKLPALAQSRAAKSLETFTVRISNKRYRFPKNITWNEFDHELNNELSIGEDEVRVFRSTTGDKRDREWRPLNYKEELEKIIKSYSIAGVEVKAMKSVRSPTYILWDSPS